jgi:hypothetical protein
MGGRAGHKRRGRAILSLVKLASRRLFHVVAALTGAGLAVNARADVVPSNVRPCEGATEGQPCQTDECTPGTCRATTGLLCKDEPPDCWPCMFGMIDAGRSCDEVCASTRRPCVVCLSGAPKSDAGHPVYRWHDCHDKHPGEACKTEACEDGRCEPPPCDAPPCPPPDAGLECAPARPDAPPSPLVLGVAGGLVLLLGALAGGGIRWRRARRSRRPLPAPGTPGRGEA